MKAAEATIGELATTGDIKSAGGDSYEITDRGRTALARAERDGLV
jgi:predicted transcriptional regulator